VQLKCCGIENRIPKFLQDSVQSFSENILVEKKIIEKLPNSKYPFEIRNFSTDGLFQETVHIVKCSGDSLRIEKYQIFWFSKKRHMENQLETSFKKYNNLGNDTTFAVFVRKTTDNAILLNSNRRDLITQLITNHIYDLPGSDDITKQILKAHPKTQVIQMGIGPSYSILEFKLSTFCRSIRLYPKDYNPEPEDVNNYKYKNEILNILSQLTKGF